jgi:hypothetical protein
MGLLITSGGASGGYQGAKRENMNVLEETTPPDLHIAPPLLITAVAGMSIKLSKSAVVELAEDVSRCRREYECLGSK